MKRKRIKIYYGNLTILLLVIGFVGYGVYFVFNKFSDNDTKNEKIVKKLADLGYSKEEAKDINNNLNEEDIKSIDKKYDRLDELAKIKYFHIENIDRYEELMNKSSYEIDEIVMRVNTNIDKDFYTDIRTIEDPDDLFVLVNKYNALPLDFEPKDLVSVGNGEKLRREAAEAYLKMEEAINDYGLDLIAQSGYRSIEKQTRIYNNNVASRGQAATDLVSARPGHSEHHTGLAIDVSHDGTLEKTFENTEQFEWLKDNAYKYGFIMRYPKDKIYMTGYDYEPWHYRFVGIETATLIHTENITYEEYLVKYKGLY